MRDYFSNNKDKKCVDVYVESYTSIHLWNDRSGSV